jgi:hypothetical protein
MRSGNMKEIRAKEGMYLTQSAEVKNRVFVTAIKGANVNEVDWREATLQEKEEWEKAHEEPKAE